MPPSSQNRRTKFLQRHTSAEQTFSCRDYPVLPLQIGGPGAVIVGCIEVLAIRTEEVRLDLRVPHSLGQGADGFSVHRGTGAIDRMGPAGSGTQQNTLC